MKYSVTILKGTVWPDDPHRPNVLNTRPMTQSGKRSLKWQAVIEKDPSADGKFYFSIKTTGVFCLPSCPARPPLRKNVAFHNTPADAEQAGFRACKRCWPKGPKLTAPTRQR